MRRILSALTVAAAALACATAAAAPRAVEPKASEIAFSVKQMGVAVSGTFSRYAAQLEFDPAQPEQASASIEVDIASLSTGDDDADAVALDKPWLDKLGFPKARFVSRSVRALGANRFEAVGALTIRDKTRELSVPFTTRELPGGRTEVAGRFTIRRADFGIGGGEWNQGDLVANEVPVSFKFVLAPPARP